MTGLWAGWPDLAELRRSRKISVSHIAALTNIRADYLTAIERGEFDQLPGGIYTTSYIRQYARLIDYPEQDLLAMYSAKMEAPSPIHVACQPDPAPARSRSWFFRWLSDHR